MDTSELSLRKISAKETYPIRQLLLRPGRPVEEVFFEGDTDVDSFHIGVFLQDQLVGIASYMKNQHNNFGQPEQYQLRGMAVLPELQGKGAGRLLLKEGERILKEETKTRLLWCNARESVEAFYKKNKYQPFGDYFEIPGVCTHIVMYKSL